MSETHVRRAMERRNRPPVLRTTAIIGLLLASVALVACAQRDVRSAAMTALDMPPEPALDETYKLDSGDRVRVTVFGEMDLGGEFEVDGSGLVRLPLIGQVHAKGLALADFETNVKTALEQGYLRNARVSAEVINYRPFYILGQVNKPGEYAYVNGMSVLNAVALAGGYTYRANEWSVYIRRRGAEEQRLAPADQVTRVQPGDIITVRERFF